MIEVGGLVGRYERGGGVVFIWDREGCFFSQRRRI